MKRISTKTKAFWPKLSNQRFVRRLKRQDSKKHNLAGKRKSSTNSELSSIAPTRIDLYKPSNHNEFIRFKEDLNAKAASIAQSGYSKELRVCFRNTLSITAAAGLLLIATVDNIIAKYPDLSFRVTRPPNRREGLRANNLVDSVLVHIGFYRLIGHEHIKRRCDAKNVTCWSYAYGDDASGEIAAKLIDNLKSYGIKTNKLYRSCMEAVANATEHAYTDKVTPAEPFNLMRWWFFVGVLNDKITVLICDLGHGIPNTLEVTQESNIISKILEKLNLPSMPSKDCVRIQASTLVKETRTQEAYRGKGGADITTFIDITAGSKMVIFSNKGTYYYSGVHKTSIAYDNQHTVGGTIIQWTIPYTGSEEK